MNPKLVRTVWERAKSCCEYCRLPQFAFPLRFQIDHIRAGQQGETVAENLALACPYCNRRKNPNAAGLTPAYFAARINSPIGLRAITCSRFPGSIAINAKQSGSSSRFIATRNQSQTSCLMFFSNTAARSNRTFARVVGTSSRSCCLLAMPGSI